MWGVAWSSEYAICGLRLCRTVNGLVMKVWKEFDDQGVWKYVNIRQWIIKFGK